MQDMKARIVELRNERGALLELLSREADRARTSGYDFAQPHINVFGKVLQLEAALRELEWFAAQ